jgi:hypothetical protein
MPMIKRPTKSDLRHEMEKQMADYLQKGGRITSVEQGASGLTNGTYNKHQFSISQPKQTRTAVPEVLVAIDSRRRQSAVPAQKTRPRAPRRQVIYDDFGEPLRVVWVDN